VLRRCRRAGRRGRPGVRRPGRDLGYLIPHPVIRKVTFTGSTPVGKQLAALAGAHMKRVTMELGGHAPVIIAEDADVALAVKAAGAAKFRNAGQVCISPTRFLVHNAIKEEFTRALVAHAEGLKLGDGLLDGITLGPLANARRVTAMARWSKMRRPGAPVLATGGKRVGERRQLLRPDHPGRRAAGSQRVQRRALRPDRRDPRFRQPGRGDREANRLPYGLAGYAFTRSIKNAHL
jgi:succinate-semialdehyde dehydrogenase/glutarate-semialdehyde dehydrogenase